MDAVIVAEQVSKRFDIHHNRAYALKTRLLGMVYQRYRPRIEDFWALRDVSLSVGRGEAIGLVGRNGSGKSTLLKLIAGIHRPTSGRVLVRRGAKIGTMIELGVGFHPDLTGRENVFLNASVYGLDRPTVERIYDAGGRLLGDRPVHRRADQELLVGHGDAAGVRGGRAPRSRGAAARRDLRGRRSRRSRTSAARRWRSSSTRGKTLLFVSHSAASVQQICIAGVRAESWPEGVRRADRRGARALPRAG